MFASRFTHVGRPASAAFGAALVALFVAVIVAGTALAATPGTSTAKSPSGTIAAAKPVFTWSKAAHATS
jgi:hypothetical protein